VATTALAAVVVTAVHAEDANPQETASDTVQKREESRQLVPMFSKTLTAQELEERGIVSLDGVASAVPGISLTPSINSSNTPILYMRGQGLDNPSQITRDSPVSVYQDGFRIARSEALTFQVADLDSVKVLSGPRGAAYGRNTTGGVVNLISQSPTGKLRFKQSVDFGDRNLFRVLGSLDTPAWHELSAKVTLLASSIDGYVKNQLTTAHNYGEEKQRGGRLQLRWDGSSNFRADYFLERSDLDSTPAYDTNPYLNGQSIFFFPYYANPDGPVKTTYRPVDLQLSTSSHIAHGLTLTWQPVQTLTVKSLTGYRKLSAQAEQDYAESLGLPEATTDLYHHHQFSQELQFTGWFLDHAVSYAGGISYFREGGLHSRLLDFPSQSLFNAQVINTQVFAAARTESADAQLQWRPGFLFHKRLEMTAAVRYSKESKDAERFVTDSTFFGSSLLENGAASGAFNHISYRRFTPAFALSYGWTPDISTYATVSTGYRAGAALESAPVGEFASSTLRPESVRTYELGMKAALFNDLLRANIAVFSSRYQNIQYPIPINPVTDEVYSLQRARIAGLDLDLRAKPTKDLTLTGSVAYLRWNIDEVDVLAGSPLDPATGSGSPYAVGDNVKNLFALQYAPKYNFNVGGDYTFWHLYRGDISTHLDYVYRGKMFNDPAAGPAVPGREFDTIPGFGLLNARLTYSKETDWSHHVKVSLWGRNVLNRKYYALTRGYWDVRQGSGVSAFQTSASGITTPVGWVARLGAWAEPATYGIYASYEY